LVLGFFVGKIQPSGDSAPEVQTSLKINDPATAAFVMHRVTTLQWPGKDGATSQFEFAGKSEPASHLTLRGSEPLIIPDDHGQNTLTLVGIDQGRATIAVMSRFDHRSFGKNLVTVDCGVVELEVVESLRRSNAPVTE
jgi:hypothetical protein